MVVCLNLFLLCTQRQSRDRSHLRPRRPAVAAPAAAKSKAVSGPVCSGVIDRNYAPPSWHECDEEWRRGFPRRGGRVGGRGVERKERSTPTGFGSSMRAIHDVSSGRLHTGVMKAFLRGSIRANWPSWINRGGGAERIHQTSPHLCEMSKERHARVLHLSGLNMFGRHSASPRAAVLPLHLAVILILSPYPATSPPHPPNPRTATHSKSTSRSALVSVPISDS